jgi:hypothetical protein
LDGAGLRSWIMAGVDFVLATEVLVTIFRVPVWA